MRITFNPATVMKTAPLERSQTSQPGVFSPAVFRSICSLLPAGVTVVTRTLKDGSPYGITVSSFTSVSLDPALILICIDRSAGFLDGLLEGAPFIVNVLREGQQEVAVRFSELPPQDRFTDVEWDGGWNGLPLLRGVVASFGCLLDRAIEAGDHVILLGLVHDLARYEGRSLVWCERGYHRLPEISS